MHIKLIEDYISKGLLGKAIDYLVQNKQNLPLDDSIVIISGAYNRMLKQQVSGVISNDEFCRESNRIAQSIINLIKYKDEAYSNNDIDSIIIRDSNINTTSGDIIIGGKKTKQ